MLTKSNTADIRFTQSEAEASWSHMHAPYVALASLRHLIASAEEPLRFGLWD